MEKNILQKDIVDENDPASTNLSSTDSEGLTQAEAEQRLLKYGYNELAEEKTNPLLKFLSYFWGPIPWMIDHSIAQQHCDGHGANSARHGSYHRGDL